jgi:hypothetical protein
MKINIKQEVDVKTLSVKANVRYWEDATVNNEEDTTGEFIPCRQGDLWCPEIDIDTGVITNWKNGVKAEIHYKICDEGSYYLKDATGNIVASIEDNYVPSIMCPKDSGYGDYIIMDVDENGKISDWDSSDLLTWDAFGDEN